MVNRIFYNYIYLDPTKPVNFKIKGLDIILKYEPFYVGKGKKNRLNDHKRGRSGPFMKAKMKSLNDKDIIPIVLKINPNISDYESKKNEKYLIKAIGRRDLGLGPLCNLTDGGDGTCNKVITEKARSHSGTFKKGHTPWLKDKKMCNETKNKLSVSNKGKPGPRKEKYMVPKSCFQWVDHLVEQSCITSSNKCNAKKLKKIKIDRRLPQKI